MYTGQGSALHRLFILLCCALLAPAMAMVEAADWRGDLEGGGQVVVDPDTNRATLKRNGVETPLWDGVHRLEDGTTLTIRSGVAVPNRAILDARDQPEPPPVGEPDAPWMGRSIIGYSPCQKLVRQVCGEQDECTDAAACSPARQLLDMEWRQRRSSLSPDVMTHASGQCLEAARDPAFFATCGERPRQGVPVPRAGGGSGTPDISPPCELLVEKACGRDNRCNDAMGCDAARQLQGMAREQTGEPAAPADSHCRRGLLDDDFFPRCVR